MLEEVHDAHEIAIILVCMCAVIKYYLEKQMQNLHLHSLKVKEKIKASCNQWAKWNQILAVFILLLLGSVHSSQLRLHGHMSCKSQVRDQTVIPSWSVVQFSIHTYDHRDNSPFVLGNHFLTPSLAYPGRWSLVDRCHWVHSCPELL